MSNENLSVVPSSTVPASKCDLPTVPASKCGLSTVPAASKCVPSTKEATKLVLSTEKASNFRKVIEDLNLLSEDERRILLKATDDFIAKSQSGTAATNEDRSGNAESDGTPVRPGRKRLTKLEKRLIFLSILLYVALFLTFGLDIYFLAFDEKISDEKISDEKTSDKKTPDGNSTAAKSIKDKCPKWFMREGYSCYHLLGFRMSYEGGVYHCQKDVDGDGLAEPRTVFEINELWRFMTRSHYYDEVWIGANDKRKEGTFVWETDGVTANTALWKWDYGEPSNKYNENCIQVQLLSRKLHWIDYMCKDWKRPVCQSKMELGSNVPCPEGYTMNGSFCYRYLEEKVDFNSSVSNCKRTGGMVAEPRNIKEHNAVAKIANSNSVWMGAKYSHTERQFKWLSDEKQIGFTMWLRGQPNDSHYGLADCIQMDSAGKWDDHLCNEAIKSVCQAYPTYQVGSGSSNPNSNPGYEIESNDVSQPPQVKTVELPSHSNCYEAADRGRQSYTGIKAVTTGGHICQRWDAQDPHQHKQAEHFPGGVLPDHNYCRNPDMKSSGPWCFTINPWIRYQHCDVPICPESSPTCPKGFRLHGDFCYRYFNNYATFNNSQSQCEQLGGTLAEPRNLEEHNVVATIARINNGQVWLGATDREKEGQYLWLSDKQKVAFSVWHEGQPIYSTFIEMCIGLRENWKWNVFRCDGILKYICQIKAIRGLKTCPGGFKLKGSFCYKFFPEKKYFHEAVSACQQLGVGAMLAEPRSGAENRHITDLALEYSVTGNIWIGLTDKPTEGTFRYSSTGQPVYIYKNWERDAPNDYNGIQDCAEIIVNQIYPLTNRYEWNDVHCVWAHSFVCQAQPETHEVSNDIRDHHRSSFVVHSTKLNFAGASAACQREGMHLAMPKTAVAQNALTELVNYANDYVFWIGMQRDDGPNKWKWVDNSPLGAFKNWAANQPNNYNKNQNCVDFRIPSPSSGIDGWNDGFCHDKQAFICQKPDIPAESPRVKCPSGYNLANFGSKCYSLNNHPLNFKDAVKACKNSGGFLAEPKTMEENNAVAQFSRGKNVWIGASDKLGGEGNFHWLSNNMSIGFTKWWRGQPSGERDRRDCLQMRGDKTWSSGDCDRFDMRATVCQAPLLKGCLKPWKCEVNRFFKCFPPKSRHHVCRLIQVNSESVTLRGGHREHSWNVSVVIDKEGTLECSHKLNLTEMAAFGFLGTFFPRMVYHKTLKFEMEFRSQFSQEKGINITMVVRDQFGYYPSENRWV